MRDQSLSGDILLKWRFLYLTDFDDVITVMTSLWRHHDPRWVIFGFIRNFRPPLVILPSFIANLQVYGILWLGGPYGPPMVNRFFKLYFYGFPSTAWLIGLTRSYLRWTQSCFWVGYRQFFVCLCLLLFFVCFCLHMTSAKFVQK